MKILLWLLILICSSCTVKNQWVQQQEREYVLTDTSYDGTFKYRILYNCIYYELQRGDSIESYVIEKLFEGTRENGNIRIIKVPPPDTSIYHKPR